MVNCWTGTGYWDRAKFPPYWTEPCATRVWRKRHVNVRSEEYRPIVHRIETLCRNLQLDIEVKDGQNFGKR